VPTQTSIPIPPRLLIRCRRSERGNLEANVATTIRQKIAAHYITASTEFSNPASLMRNSSFLIWVWLPLIWNRVFLIWGALSPMRNSPFLIRVRPLLIWDSPLLIWGALSPMRSSPFLIRVELSLILEWPIPHLGRLSPDEEYPIPDWGLAFPNEEKPISHLGKGFPIQGSWLSGELRKPQAGRVWSPGATRWNPAVEEVSRIQLGQGCVPVWQVRGGISHPASGTGQTDVPLQDARRSLRGS